MELVGKLVYKTMIYPAGAWQRSISLLEYFKFALNSKICPTRFQLHFELTEERL